jgi:hypothetical protein
MPAGKKSEPEPIDVAALEREGYLPIPKKKNPPKRKKRQSRVAGTLPESFAADNITGRETYPTWWETAFRTFADIADSAGAATAIEVYEKVLSRARKALVKPSKKTRTAADSDGDVRALGAWLALRRQGKTAEEAIELIEPHPRRQEALLRRLQRLQRFFDQPYFRGDN